MLFAAHIMSQQTTASRLPRYGNWPAETQSHWPLSRFVDAFLIECSSKS